MPLPTTNQPGETVSVVIPTRNRPRMVAAAVRSALAQTYPPHEVIVVIDGPESPDVAEAECTAEVLRAISDLRVHVISLPQSVGGGEARNIGVRAAGGQWIAFLDDDDLWLPEKLEQQIAFARTLSGCAVLSCPVLARGPEWEEVWPREPYRTGEPISEYLFCRRGFRYGTALLQTSTLLAPRELLLRIPFTPGLLKHQDWDWLLRVAADPNVSIHSVGTQPLAIFHVEGQRSSVGRAPNWRFSLDWARSRRSFFTPRAFAGFLATECAAQAAQASWPERLALLRAFLRAGAPRVASLLQLIVFLFVPQIWRRRVREALRDSDDPRARRQPVPAK